MRPCGQKSKNTLKIIILNQDLIKIEISFSNNNMSFKYLKSDFSIENIDIYFFTLVIIILDSIANMTTCYWALIH